MYYDASVYCVNKFKKVFKFYAESPCQVICNRFLQAFLRGRLKVNVRIANTYNSICIYS